MVYVGYWRERLREAVGSAAVVAFENSADQLLERRSVSNAGPVEGEGSPFSSMSKVWTGFSNAVVICSSLFLLVELCFKPLFLERLKPQQKMPQSSCTINQATKGARQFLTATAASVTAYERC